MPALLGAVWPGGRVAAGPALGDEQRWTLRRATRPGVRHRWGGGAPHFCLLHCTPKPMCALRCSRFPHACSVGRRLRWNSRLWCACDCCCRLPGTGECAWHQQSVTCLALCVLPLCAALLRASRLAVLLAGAGVRCGVAVVGGHGRAISHAVAGDGAGGQGRCVDGVAGASAAQRWQHASPLVQPPSSQGWRVIMAL